MPEAQTKRAAPLSGAAPSLGEFIHSHKGEIVRAWEAQVQKRTGKDARRESLLVDRLSELLDRTSDLLLRGGAAPPSILGDVSERHATIDLAEGRDLSLLVGEYSILRNTVFELWEADAAHVTRPEETRRFNDLIDTAIAAAVERYVEAKERTLHALDGVAEAASGDVDQVVQRLLHVFFEATESIDSVELFVESEGKLERRASFGADGDDIGESQALAEIVARSCQPQERGTSEGERTNPPVGRSTLFGVPLIQGSRPIGVLVLGSRTLGQLSNEDKALLSMAASHASSHILQAELFEARKRASDREDAVKKHAGEFAEITTAMLGHDLRNPLNIITLGASALKSSPNLDERQLKNLQRIEDHAQRMARMISDFLDLTRSRLGGGIPVNVRSIDFHQIAKHVLEGVESANPGRQFRLQTDGPALGKGDADRVAQALTNLVMNALQYGAEGAPIDVAVKDLPDAIVLEVHNQGEPIPKDALGHMFEPFRRGRAHREKKPYAGLGLGLFIVREIAGAHGGDVAVQSAPGAGTTFRVRFPK